MAAPRERESIEKIISDLTAKRILLEKRFKEIDDLITLCDAANLSLQEFKENLPSLKRPKKPCAHEGCLLKAQHKQYCSHHAPLHDIEVKWAYCKVEGCNLKRVARGMCHNHDKSSR